MHPCHDGLPGQNGPVQMLRALPSGKLASNCSQHGQSSHGAWQFEMGESQVRRDLMEKLISECQTWSTLMTKHLPAEALRSTSNAQRDWWINMTCDRRLNRPIDCPNTQYTHVYACLSTQQELCQQPSCDASCEKRLCIASSQPGLSLKTSKPSKMNWNNGNGQTMWLMILNCLYSTRMALFCNEPIQTVL